MRARGLPLAAGGMDAGGRILDRDDLRAGRLRVDLGARQRRQQVGRARRDQMRAVELGGDLHRQVEPAPLLLHQQALGDRAQEVAAEAEEGADLARDDGLAGLDCVQAVLARRLEAVLLRQTVEGHEFGLLGDADGALALHVGMAPHRADARARLADLAAHQQQVDQHLHVVDAEPVLRQPHAIDGDDGLRPGKGERRGLQLRARQARGLLDLGPAGRARLRLEGLEALGVPGDKVDVEDTRRAGGPGRVVQREDRLGHAHHRGDVAARAQLMVLRGDLRGPVRQHLARALRVHEGLPSPLAQRVEDDDRHVALPRLLEVVQQAGRVGADVLAEGEDAVGPGEILQQDGADRRADALGQGHGGRLVAHVGAVGQVVGPDEPRQKLVHVGGLEGGPAGGVEDDAVWREGFQPRADVREGLFPGDGPVDVGRRVVAHRMGQPPLVLEVVVGPGEQVGNLVRREELGRRALRGQVPEGRLPAVLAELRRMGLGRLRPGAARAHVSAGLVVAPDEFRSDAESMLPPGMLGQRRHGAPAPGRLFVGFMANALRHKGVSGKGLPCQSPVRPYVPPAGGFSDDGGAPGRGAGPPGPPLA